MGIALCLCNTKAKLAINEGYSMKCGICVCGLNGSGKTTLAGALAKKINFFFNATGRLQLKCIGKRTFNKYDVQR